MQLLIARRAAALLVVRLVVRLAVLLAATVAARVAAAQPLTLTLSAQKSAYQLGEPVTLLVTLHNTGSQPEMVIPRLDATEGNVTYEVIAPDGTRRLFHPAWRDELLVQPLALAGGKSVTGVAHLYGSPGEPPFDRPGDYQVTGSYHGVASPPGLVRVLPPASAAAEAQGRLLLDPAVQLFLRARGGEHLVGARSLLAQATTGPSPLLASYAHFALGAYHAQNARDFEHRRIRPADPARAVTELGLALQQPLGDATRAEAQAYLGRAYQLAGRNVQADSVMRALRSRAAEDPAARAAVERWRMEQASAPPN